MGTLSRATTPSSRASTPQDVDFSLLFALNKPVRVTQAMVDHVWGQVRRKVKKAMLDGNIAEAHRLVVKHNQVRTPEPERASVPPVPAHEPARASVPPVPRQMTNRAPQNHEAPRATVPPPSCVSKVVYDLAVDAQHDAEKRARMAEAQTASTQRNLDELGQRYEQSQKRARLAEDREQRLHHVARNATLAAASVSKATSKANKLMTLVSQAATTTLATAPASSITLDATRQLHRYTETYKRVAGDLPLDEATLRQNWKTVLDVCAERSRAQTHTHTPPQ